MKQKEKKKQKWNLRILITLALIALFWPIAQGPELPLILKESKINEIKEFVTTKNLLIFYQEEYEKFLIDLAYSESSLLWWNYNEQGYIGFWAMGTSARKTVGYDHVTFADFKRNPAIFPVEHQIDAITKLLLINYQTLKPIIDQTPLIYDGIIITKSGILGAAHLAGAGGVQRFFATNGQRDPKDINGTSLSFYMKKFSSYEFDLNLISHPNHKQGYLYTYLKTVKN